MEDTWNVLEDSKGGSPRVMGENWMIPKENLHALWESPNVMEDPWNVMEDSKGGSPRVMGENWKIPKENLHGL